MKFSIPKKPIVIKNKDFQTIIVRVMFPINEEEEDLAKLSIFSNLVCYMSNTYPTEEEFQNTRKKKFILNVGCAKIMVGRSVFVCFSLVIPDIKTLGFDNLNEQFEFFSDAIYNPKVIDNGFDKFEVEREIRNLKMSIENGLKNLRFYHSVKAGELVDDETGIFSRTIENHRELIDELTPTNLYQFYKELLEKHKPTIVVFGNVDEERISELADKYLYKNNGLDEFETSYNHFLKIRDKVQVVEEKKDFKDSVVSFFYKIKDYSEDDFDKLSLVRGLLGSLSSRLLNKKLRDENDLVYSSAVSAYMRYGVFSISAFINKDNKDLVIEKLYEVMDELKDPDNIAEFLDNIKDRKRLNLIRSLDDKFALLNDACYELLGVEKNMNDNYQDILKISAEDISKFVDRFVLDTIYYIEEEEHE